jgi:hypothetical protein
VSVELEFTDTVFEWRGPAPYHFVRVPDDVAALVADLAGAISYGWGMVPAQVGVGATTVRTALWPKDGSYYVPLKDRLRTAEGFGLGDQITVRLTLDV